MTLHMSLDVISFFDSQERKYGLDAVRLKPDSSTAAISMVAVDGSPITVGWFQNTGRAALPRSSRNVHAITTVPAHAETIHHRVILEQTPSQQGEALWREEDDDLYLEGIDDNPQVLGVRLLGQPALNDLIQELTGNALVLNTTEAEYYAKMSRELGLVGLREYGMDLRETIGTGLGFVTFD
jgi:hypothetical protein